MNMKNWYLAVAILLRLNEIVVLNGHSLLGSFSILGFDYDIGEKGVSFDGDADRIVYFYKDSGLYLLRTVDLDVQKKSHRQGMVKCR